MTKPYSASSTLDLECLEKRSDSVNRSGRRLGRGCLPLLCAPPLGKSDANGLDNVTHIIRS